MAFENGGITENGSIGKSVQIGGNLKKIDTLPNGRRLVGAEARNLEEFAEYKKQNPDTILEASDFISH